MCLEVPVSVQDRAQYNHPEISVVAPAYNEEWNLRPLIVEIKETLDTAGLGDYEIILVDDASTDASREVIEHCSLIYEDVRGITLKRNVGQSAALDAGVDSARGDVIVTIDADGQNPPNEIPALVDQLQEGADCVSGWRHERNDPLRKRIPSDIQTHLARLTGCDIHDFGCGLKAYRAEAIRGLDLRGESHRYIPAMLHRAGYRVEERRVDHRPRTHGNSSYGLGRLSRGFVDLLFHVFWSRWGTRPMHIFGVLGVVMFALGGCLGGWLLIENYLLGSQLLPNLPQLVLSVALSLFGFGLFSFGVLTELLTNLLYRDEEPYRIAARYE